MSVLVGQTPLACHDEIERRFRRGSAAFQRHFMKVAAKMSALYKELFPEGFNTERKFHRQSSPLEENVFTHKPNAELGGREELTFHTVGCQTEENVAFSVTSEACHDSLAFPVASEASGDTEQTFHRRQRLLKKHLIGYILKAATERVQQPWQAVETDTERDGSLSAASEASRDTIAFPAASEASHDIVAFPAASEASRDTTAFLAASEASHDTVAFPVASGDTEQTFHRRHRLLKKHLIGSKLMAATERVEDPWQTVETETERNGSFPVVPGNEGQYRKDKEHLEKGFGTYTANAATIREEQLCHATRVAGGEVLPAEAEEAEAERFRRGCGTLQQHFVKTRKAEMPIVTTQAVVRLILI